MPPKKGTTKKRSQDHFPKKQESTQERSVIIMVKYLLKERNMAYQLN